MRTLFSSMIATWTVLPWLSGVVAQTPEMPSTTAFLHVAVIPMDSDRERVLSDQTVLVRGNRIVALGPAAEVDVPVGARQIEAKGKFLLPGLSDMHAHISANDDVGLFLALANGVTTLRDMGFAKNLPALHAKRTNGAAMPPRLYGVVRVEDCDSLMFAACFGEKALGYDMLKLYEDARAAQLDPIITAAKHAGLRVGGHAVPGPGIDWALGVPYRSIEHLQGYPSAIIGQPIWPEDSAGGLERDVPDTAFWVQPGYKLPVERLRAVAEATQRAGAWNAPTLIGMDGIVASFEMAGQQRAFGRYVEFLSQIVKALHDAGAPLLLSEDMMARPNPAGYALHRELELFVQAGLSPYDALITGTRNVATYLGTQDSAGTVAVGKWADLLLLEANPLADIRHTTAIAGVMADGWWFSRADLDARLDAWEARGCALTELRREAAARRGISTASLRAMPGSSDASCE